MTEATLSEKIEISSLENVDDSGLTFIFKTEDHTLLNILQKYCLYDPDVQYCGYDIVHPDTNEARMRIQTRDKSAITVLEDALENLKKSCEVVRDQFREEMGLNE
ncbi:hypothetical protein SNEBB_011250 [Seison nebaliae]|nr:hypothetical protein SNEBB_011250 [Seison nebaliae]